MEEPAACGVCLARLPPSRAGGARARRHAIPTWTVAAARERCEVANPVCDDCASRVVSCPFCRAPYLPTLDRPTAPSRRQTSVFRVSAVVVSDCSVMRCRAMDLVTDLPEGDWPVVPNPSHRSIDVLICEGDVYALRRALELIGTTVFDVVFVEATSDAGIAEATIALRLLAFAGVAAASITVHGRAARRMTEAECAGVIDAADEIALRDADLDLEMDAGLIGSAGVDNLVRQTYARGMQFVGRMRVPEPDGAAGMPDAGYGFDLGDEA